MWGQQELWGEETEAGVQGHEKGAPRGSCGGVEDVGESGTPSGDAVKALDRERPKESSQRSWGHRDGAETQIWRPGHSWG